MRFWRRPTPSLCGPPPAKSTRWRRGIRPQGQALADLEQINRSPFARTRPFGHVDLKIHLEARYGIRISSLAPIDDDPATRPPGSWPGHYPSTLLVRREDGPPWIARVFSSPADQLARVEGDAEILRFLAAHDFPAEQIAHDDPVSTFDDSGVIVTQFVDGGRPADEHGRSESAEVAQELGSLLGRLHALPQAAGAVARDGGAEEADGGFYVGRPRQDLAAAMSFLASVEDKVIPGGREKFDWLRDQVENADDAEGLPEALTHSNFHLWTAVGIPGKLTIVGWAGPAPVTVRDYLRSPGSCEQRPKATRTTSTQSCEATASTSSSATTSSSDSPGS